MICLFVTLSFFCFFFFQTISTFLRASSATVRLCSRRVSPSVKSVGMRRKKSMPPNRELPLEAPIIFIFYFFILFFTFFFWFLGVLILEKMGLFFAFFLERARTSLRSSVHASNEDLLSRLRREGPKIILFVVFHPSFLPVKFDASAAAPFRSFNFFILGGPGVFESSLVGRCARKGGEKKKKELKK